MMTDSIPEATASSTTYWIKGLSTSGNISFGDALVAGRKRVPKPAAGKTALRTFCGIPGLQISDLRSQNVESPDFECEPVFITHAWGLSQMLDLNYVRENLEKVRTGLQSRGVAPEALDNFAE